MISSRNLCGEWVLEVFPLCLSVSSVIRWCKTKLLKLNSAGLGSNVGVSLLSSVIALVLETVKVEISKIGKNTAGLIRTAIVCSPAIVL